MSTAKAPWTYRGQVVETPPDGTFGFVYIIRYLGSKTIQKQYLGKKQFTHKITRKRTGKVQLTKKGVPRKRPLKTSKIKASDWASYFGSCLPLKELLKTEPPELFQREILQFAYSKRELGFLEEQYLFCERVLQNPLFFNTNIGGRHYRAHLFPDAACT